MIIIGIDPGKEGGFAILEKSTIIYSAPLPYVGDELDIAQVKRVILEYTRGRPRSAVLEKVHAMPGQGVCSMFTFGKGYGELRGLLKALEVPFHEPTPQQWKKAVLVGIDWKGNKAASCEYVMKRYPEVDLTPGKKRKPHDGIADAVCLAEFGAR